MPVDLRAAPAGGLFDPRLRALFHASLTVVVVALVGCSSTAAPAANSPNLATQPPTLAGTAAASPGGTPGPAATEAPPTLALPTPIASLGADQTALTAFKDTGMTDALALFAANTALTVTQVDPHTIDVAGATPVGSTFQITISAHDGATGDPASAQVSATETGDEMNFTVSYLVPDSNIPDSIRSQLALGSPQAILAVAQVGKSIDGRTHADASQSGVQVVATAELSQAQQAQVSSFLQFVDEELGGKAVLDPMYQAFTNGSNVLDALAANEDYTTWMSQIDRLEKCAQNPTNPLTVKAYQNDPTLKGKILEDVADTRSTIRWNAAVTFYAQLLSTASGGWLSFVVGPGVAWSQDTLKKVSQERIDELSKEITACNGYQFEFSGGTTYVDPAGTGATPNTTWHYWGVECPNQNQWQLWEQLDGWSGDYDTGKPTDSWAQPETMTLGADGTATVSYPAYGWSDTTTFAGTILILTPALIPNNVHAVIPNGEGTFPVDRPVVPYDGSFYTCPTK
jgi:hypothetical protein